MNEIIAGLIILILGFLTFCLITLNEHKEELWEEIYNKLR